MITIRTAAPEELPQLRDLWRKCFGDPGAYVDIFFQKFCCLKGNSYQTSAGYDRSICTFLQYNSLTYFKF